MPSTWKTTAPCESCARSGSVALYRRATRTTSVDSEVALPARHQCGPQNRCSQRSGPSRQTLLSRPPPRACSSSALPEFSIMPAGLLLLDQRLDLIFHFVDRLQVGLVFVFGANDVEAVRTLHEITELAFRQRERGLLKFRHGAAPSNPAKISRPASRYPGPRNISRQDPRTSRHSSAASKHLRLSLSLFLHALFVNLAIRSGRGRLDQDVTDLHFLSNIDATCARSNRPLHPRASLGSARAPCSCQIHGSYAPGWSCCTKPCCARRTPSVPGRWDATLCECRPATGQHSQT